MRVRTGRWFLHGFAAIVAASYASAVHGDLLFRSGFEDTPAMVACPTAPGLIERTGGLGGTFYDVDDAIAVPGERDFFTFPANAGDWILVGTDANAADDPDLIDTVVTVYSGDGQRQLARSDDATPRRGPDSELFYRAIESGLLCVGIEDASTARGSAPRGGPDFTYRAVAAPLDFSGAEGFNEDLEDNDTVAMPQIDINYFTDAQGQYSMVINAGFDDPADRDVFRLETPSNAVRLALFFTPDGQLGYGGTTQPGVVEILTGDGTTVLGRLDYAKGSAGIRLPADANATYLARVHSPPGPLGTNPFYVLKYETRDFENQQETKEPANNVSGGAEIASSVPSPALVSHFIGGTLAGRSDVDWWSFKADLGDSVAVFCASQRSGSGVRNMTVRLFDDLMALPRQEETESDSRDLAWGEVARATLPPVKIFITGTHYLALSASDFDAAVTDRHYECGIQVFTGAGS